MTYFTRRARIWAGGSLLLLLSQSEATGQRRTLARGTGSSTVTVVLGSPQAGRTVDPGETIEWQLHAFVDPQSEGLALFLFDLAQGPDNPELFDLPAADGVPDGMANFDRPDGFTNSGQDFTGSGYTGIQVGERGARNLTQIGGAQNVFGVAGPCFGPGTSVCLGQVVQVEAGVGQSGGGS